MKGTVNFESGAAIEMVANAASVYYYRNVFHEDFLVKVQAKKDPDADLFVKMGYIMAKQAECEKLSELAQLSIDGFYEWLSAFEPLDLILASDQISDIWAAQTEGLSAPKK